MFIHHSQRASRLSPRQTDTTESPRIAILAIVSVAIIASILVLFYIALRTLRKSHSNPKLVPTSYLKRRWRTWKPRGFTTSNKIGYTTRLHTDGSVPTLHLRSENRSTRTSAHLPESERPRVQEMETEHEVNVDRHASVRSVMTLPTYSKDARETERILGREGERGGIDVVVEAPETIEEEEDRREEEMESLYQIRLQRRRENEERIQRRQQRREARERGDFETLRRLQHESRLRAQELGASGAAVLIADHQSRSRDGRVSSVSYAELGIARHDGTRIRANSGESDRRPLLDSAASMGSVHPRMLQHETLGSHTRGRSSSSLMSASDMSDSDVEVMPPPFGRSGSDFEVATMNTTGRSRGNSRATTIQGSTYRPGSSLTRQSSDTTRPSVDLGDEGFPAHDPPSYEGFEEAPPYTSPVKTRAPPFPQSRSAHTSVDTPVDSVLQDQEDRLPSPNSRGTGAPWLPEIGRLPTIRIAEATPIEPRSSQSFR